MGLLAYRVELAHWPEIGILLEGDRPLRRETAGNTHRRREIQVLVAVIGGIENRVDDDVHRLQMPADDRL